MRPMLVEREITSEGPGAKAPRRGSRSIKVNLAESPLSWLHARGHITPRQFIAGERLRADWECAQLAPSISMSWDPVRIKNTGQALSATERQLAARSRFDGAVAKAGSGLADILWRVVCAGESLPTAEKELEWPARSGKLVLSIALDRVAEFYRVG